MAPLYVNVPLWIGHMGLNTVICAAPTEQQARAIVVQWDTQRAPHRRPGRAWVRLATERDIEDFELAGRLPAWAAEYATVEPLVDPNQEELAL